VPHGTRLCIYFPADPTHHYPRAKLPLPLGQVFHTLPNNIGYIPIWYIHVYISNHIGLKGVWNNTLYRISFGYSPLAIPTKGI
jgi:hypothetical protein